jgi:hypothetical protein
MMKLYGIRNHVVLGAEYSILAMTKRKLSGILNMLIIPMLNFQVFLNNIMIIHLLVYKGSVVLLAALTVESACAVTVSVGSTIVSLLIN